LKLPTVTLSRADVLAIIVGLVSGELSRSRPNQFNRNISIGWNDTTSLTDGGLELDSIELLQISSAVDEFFHLHETGLEEYLLRHRTLGGWCDIVLQAFPRGHRHFTFRTSGSQGVAKANRHRTSPLLQEIAILARLFRGRRRIVASVSPHHIYGFLFSILLPQALRVPVVMAREWPATKVLRVLGAGDLVIGFPLMWQQIERRAKRISPDVFGVTSTAPCDPRIIESLRYLGLDKMTEVYGASETGGIGYRHDPAKPYRLFSHWQRLASQSKHGEDFSLKRPNAKAIVLPDRLQWFGVRTFRPLTRRDDAVQVAGVNVYPQDIAHRLREHPAVQDCVVRLMRANEGDRLKAYFVLKKKCNNVALQPPLEAWIYERFAAPERPVALTFGESLPVTAAGKLADW
jgi:long-chain acyl-CoA synthetase